LTIASLGVWVLVWVLV